MSAKKYKVGIVIGRFQPFHLGHKYIIEKAIDNVDRLILGIGAADVRDVDNPYDVKKRVEFLNKFVKEEKLEKKISRIVPLNNHPDDAIWLKNLLKKTGKIDVVIGNNEWVNGIFENAKIPALRIGHYKRNILEGTKIRKLMRENKKWETRVPKYLLKHIVKP